MPTNDERRGAADALTDLLLGTITWPGMFKALGVRTRQDAVARLINLIEPEERTCHIDMVSSGEWECDACGGGIDWDSYDEGDPPNCNYCPNCGARVIQE